MRHEKHGGEGCIKQQLATDAIQRARERGRKLRERFSKINQVFSSPQPRCLATVIETLIGFGTLIPIETDDNLGDISIDVDPEPLKAKAKELGIGVEELCLQPASVSPEFDNIMLNRARMGTIALLSITKKHGGQTVLVCSHGGSRMEASILGIKKSLLTSASTEKFSELGLPKKNFEPGEICRLVIDQDNNLLEEEYLEL